VPTWRGSCPGSSGAKNSSEPQKWRIVSRSRWNARCWLDLIAAGKLTKHKEFVGWLKADYGVGHGHATALVGYALAQQWAADAPEERRP
jgi:hypothetical protein